MITRSAASAVRTLLIGASLALLLSSLPACGWEDKSGLAAVETVQVPAQRLRRLDRVPHRRPMPDNAPKHRGAVSGDDVVAEDGVVDVVPFRNLLQGLIHRRDVAVTGSSGTGRDAGFPSLPGRPVRAARWRRPVEDSKARRGVPGVRPGVKFQPSMTMS
jgi:hypothetical protein